MNVGLRTLGIETSCDETAVAVLDPSGRVEVHLLASQVTAHRPHGGVVPELASREHLRALPRLADDALRSIDGEVEAVAVTGGPGLVGALLVGVRFAAAFAWARSLPLLAVDHLAGHLVSPFLDLDGEPARPMPSPTLALIASGGHSAWYLVDADGASERLCRTRDDAAGETFDKVAQALGLPYPGGPVVDRLAADGDPTAIQLPRSRITDAPLDMSFSGLKSATIRELRRRDLGAIDEASAGPAVRDLLASFQEAVVDQLLAPASDLVAAHRPRLLTASGGVAANSRLRERLRRLGDELDLEVLLPPPALTTDNAAMIARAGQLAMARGDRDDPRRLDAWTREVWQPPGMRRQARPGTGTMHRMQAERA
jgi:N6-L-threonylcarbamoyladenine synthase